MTVDFVIHHLHSVHIHKRFLNGLYNQKERSKTCFSLPVDTAFVLRLTFVNLHFKNECVRT